MNISENKRKKAEFIEKAREHEEVIKGLRSKLGESMSSLAATPSSIGQEAQHLDHTAADILKQRDNKHASVSFRSRQSPGPSMVYFSPERREGASYLSPRSLISSYPRTSTPTRRS